MPDTLRIKRRPAAGAAGAPASLAASEIAFNEKDDVLYYGKGDSSGIATSIIPIAGPGAFVTNATLTAGYQPLDPDLTSLAAASGTNTIYYRSAANTWSPVTIGGNMTFSGGTLNSTGGAGGTPGGATTNIQFNNAGAFGGTASFTWVEPALRIGAIGNGGQIRLTGNASGVVTVQPVASSTTYNFNLPSNAGTSGQPLLSGGGGSTGMSFSTLSAAHGGTGTTTGISAAMQTALDLKYDKTGGVLTGGAVIQPASGGAALTINPVAATQQSTVNFYQTHAPKWQIGKNADNSFFVYDNTAGAYVLTIASNGTTIDLNRAVAVNSTLTATGVINGNAGIHTKNGVLYFGAGGTEYISYGGATFAFTAASVPCGLYSSGISCTTTGTYRPGGGAWVDSSDVRIKNVIEDYTAGLSAITELKPVRYTFKGNDTGTTPPEPGDTVPYKNSPHHQAAVDERVYIGFRGQQIEDYFPELVTLQSGYIDGVLVHNQRIVDTSALIYSLVNAVQELDKRQTTLDNMTGIIQELKTRIEALESR